MQLVSIAERFYSLGQHTLRRPSACAQLAVQQLSLQLAGVLQRDRHLESAQAIMRNAADGQAHWDVVRKQLLGESDQHAVRLIQVFLKRHQQSQKQKQRESKQKLRRKGVSDAARELLIDCVADCCHSAGSKLQHNQKSITPLPSLHHAFWLQ